jgi:polyhydroxyalkanoate synthesis regulator phasin
MLNIIKKSMLTGIGLALIAKDEVEDLAKELVNKGKMSETEGTKFLADLQSRYDETQKRLEEKVQQAVKDFMKKADVVTGDELKGLKKEIRDLKKAIGKAGDTSE